MHRGPLLVALSLVLVAGCAESSRVDPDAVVTVSGNVVAADGLALSERPVRLATGVGAGDAALAVFTLGLACTAELCDDDVRTTTTDAAGDFRLEVQGRDTQTALGGVRPQLLSAVAAPRGSEVSGASATAEFVVQTTAVQLPPLRMVDPLLSLRASASSVDASWQTTAGGPYVLTFEDEDGTTTPVWEVTSAGRSATVDERVLEDTRGRAVLSGGSTDQIEGSDVRLTWRAPGQGYAAAAGAPPSRGRPCRYDPDTGGNEKCGLTDGDLVSRAVLGGSCPPTVPGSPPPTCPPPRAAVLSVSPEQARDLVVVRGCVGTCAVEVSRDGRTFTRAGTASGDFVAVRLPATPLAAVRVGLGEEGLREVSVWPPADAAPALGPPVRGRGRRVARPVHGDGRDGPPTLLVALAVGLVAVLLLAVGFVLGTRRRSTGALRTAAS